MDRDNILSILRDINAQNVTVLLNDVQCSCFLADWRSGHTAGSDHAGSMGIRISEDGVSWVHCFSCHYRGTLVSALKAYQGYSKTNISELIRRAEGLEEQDPEILAASVPNYDKKKDEVVRQIAVGPCVPRILFQSGRAHKSIFARGFSPALLKQWDVHYDSSRKRTVFFVQSRESFSLGCGKSSLVGAIGRAAYNYQSVKYFNYFRFDKSNFLFGEHLLAGAKCAVLVEGVFDTLAVFNAVQDSGLQNRYGALGIMGSDISEIQLKKILNWFDEVVLFLDNDPAGWTATRRAAERLYRSTLLRAVKYPKIEKSDPADLFKDGVDLIQLIESAPLVVI